jgi:lycopene cyclase domain-containing protein
MTYLALASVFLLVSAAFMGAVVVMRRPGRSWWLATALTAVAMVALTAVFDSLMIAADLFRFDESALVGIHVGLAPLEDFAWPVAAVAVVPSVLLLAAPRKRRTPPRGSRPAPKEPSR